MSQSDEIEQLFEELAALAPNERERRLARCDDPQLREQLTALLKARRGPLDDPDWVGSFLRGALATGELAPDGLLATSGDQFGPYGVVALLGVGGMGCVYLAEQREPVERSVAVKVIKPGMDSRQVIARLAGERQALARMNHPHIAAFLDGGWTERGLPYFVMEYVEGEPITRFCDRRRLSIRERLPLFLDVCAGVHHAHQRGVIHRDLKPSNVLVTEDDEGRPVAKVIDFGVAKALDQRLSDVTMLTANGHAIGTPQFMSPEQIEGSSSSLDTRADVYSLGALLYELLVGAPPLDGEAFVRCDLVEIRQIVTQQDPLPPSRRLRSDASLLAERAEHRSSDPTRLPRTLSGDLDWVCARALEKDPERRYGSARELADDVERFVRHETVEATPASLPYRLRKFGRRHRGPVLAVASVMIALIAGFGWALWERENERRIRQRVTRLSDLKRLEYARLAADRLWPATYDRTPQLRQWLSEVAAPIVERRAGHRAVLFELRKNTTPTDESRRIWNFDDADKQWEHDELRDLLVDLDRFTDPDPFVGTVASVKRRIQEANRIHFATIRGPEADDSWRRAIAAIAQSPKYHNVAIRPLEGFLPLDENPRTGLWEFWHVGTGTRPQLNPAWSGNSADRDESIVGSRSRWIITGDTGVVLVLLPGGSFNMGAEPFRLGIEWSEDHSNGELRAVSVSEPGYGAELDIRPGDVVTHVDRTPIVGLAALRRTLDRKREHDPLEIHLLRAGSPITARGNVPSGNFDPWARPIEGRVHRVIVEPFFCSKYELTQGQWKRLTGQAPAYWNPDKFPGEIDWRHPVESVGWTEAECELRHHHLLLPTEEQWEYACRAGTSTPLWTGESATAEACNVCGLEYGRRFPNEPAPMFDLDDGFPRHAPAGSFEPNAWGIHELHGNVAEWCRNPIYFYPGGYADGSTEKPQTSERAIRGGGFTTVPAGLRTSHRSSGRAVGGAGGYTGIRPVWELEGATALVAEVSAADASGLDR